MSDRKKADKNLLDYVKTNGRSFDDMPFNNADGLVFTQVANMRLENSGIDLYEDGTKSLAQLYKDMQDGLAHAPAKRSFYAMSEDNRQLLQALAQSPRFSGVEVGSFVENPASRGIDGFPALAGEAAIEQFAAVTLTYMQKGEPVHYMAFRATDGSADGWTEDLLMLASSCTQSQEDSKNYMNVVGARLNGSLFGGGHSKGGNNFEYGYLFCADAVRSRIKAGYLYDSPGLYKGVIDKAPYDPLFQQVIRGHFLCPQDAIIGLLLHENQNASFVYSVESGLGEHDPYSWEINPETGDFQPAEQTLLSKYINDALDRSVNKMTAAEREALYAFAYYIMQSYGDSDAKGRPLEGGVGKIIRLFTHGWHTETGQLRLAKLGEIWQVFADDWESMSEEKQAFFLESLGRIVTSFAAVSARYAWDAAEKWAAQIKEQTELALKNAVGGIDSWVSQKEEPCKQLLLSACDAVEKQVGGLLEQHSTPLGQQPLPEQHKQPDQHKMAKLGGKTEETAAAVISKTNEADEPALPTIAVTQDNTPDLPQLETVDLRRYASRLRRVSRTLSVLDVQMDVLLSAADQRSDTRTNSMISLLTYSWQASQCAAWLEDRAGQREAAFDRGEGTIR